MLTLDRNKQSVWYALYEGVADVVDSQGYKTGEKTKTYAAPVEMRANVSASRGTSITEGFGVLEDYDRTIVTHDMSCPVTETTRLWVDANHETEPYDYRVVRVAKSINSITIAISKVKVSNA